jgi:glycine/D-amino acid oxidase-like deaminating enzyme
VQALTALGIPAQAWSQQEVEARLGGWLGPALFMPDDGRIDVATTLARWRGDGAVWVRGTARFVHDGSDGVVVQVGDQRLQAEVAVIAAGWRSAGLDASLHGRLTPVRDQFLRTAPVSRHLPLGRAGQGWTAWQQDAAGCLVVSGCRWASAHLEVGESDPVVVPKIQERLEAFLRDRLQIDAPVQDRWARVFASTPDGLPLVGPLPGDSRRIVCAGFGSSPVAWSVAAARAVADGILEGTGRVPDSVASRRLVRWRG